TGRYPPGSTFKIVTAVAALEAKQVTADSPVACPATTSIGERVVPNDHLFDLGTVPLHTAFARSCNTTFAQLAASLGAGALTDAVRAMMREAVTQGTAKTLAGQGQLFGKTGTAEEGALAHGWFVGFRGDVAFATLVVGAGSSSPALDVSGSFLSALAPPP